MVVLLVTDVDKICELFTHNPLKWTQGKPTFLSLIVIHKEHIDNAIKSESDFGGGHHGCACAVMGNQQYNLHYKIAFVPPRKPVFSPVSPINTTHCNIAAAY